MILRRVTEHLGKQHWTAVFLDFVIVVLGVFLGIQAANWNESRRDRAEERRYYAQILDDLRVDQQSLQGAIKRSANFDAAAEDTLQAMRTGLPQGVKPGRFAVQIHYAGYLYIPRASRRTYDELISTGNLGLLRNQKAKTAIAAYYSEFDDLRQWDELLRRQQGRYWEVTAGVLPRTALKAAILNHEPELAPADASEILVRLRARAGVDDILVSMAAHQARVRRDSEALKEKGRALIAKLEPLAAG